ncbi:putative methyltransferase C9orf114 [Dreissena polymorpha]|uniref:28S rRNA (uridine-N(3))-methyltransferase n=1 Tax=Dreissena polymorpha TaxID=45954 RepID=A0A9D4DIA9_DREPO|nr:putative methyltransferase C9orf114 [Dreissena polymorpha]KAH3749326.1 hypothetical protein DPMN_183822 [Dreissena polymorpha]
MEAPMYAKKYSERPTNPKELIKWKNEKKARKRKLKEEKLLAQMKKKKEEEQAEETQNIKLVEEEQTQKTKGRPYTVSIAVPGSILDNALTPELRTYLAGQIARAAAVFNVDEIIVFDESGYTEKSTDGEFKGIGKHGHGNVQLARILQYLECPQYLRKVFFPQHKDLQYAGLLNPLYCPHHMRAEEQTPYREGVVLNKPPKEGRGSFVNVGLLKDCQIDKHLKAGLRVTVKMDNSTWDRKNVKGVVVPPSQPRTHQGLYWGYTVRLANSLGTVFEECPYKEMYDLTIGTSDTGKSVDQFEAPTKEFRHMLIVFGGMHGLSASLECDETLDMDDPSLLFQHYLNTCPGQGSSTIRTEEAILITMSALRQKLFSRPKANDDT